MKKILIVFSLIFLSGCNLDSREFDYRWLVVHPDKALYRCPVLKHFPDWKTLTEKQVADTIRILQKNNVTCKSNINQIKRFLDNADMAINSK